MPTNVSHNSFRFSATISPATPQATAATDTAVRTGVKEIAPFLATLCTPSKTVRNDSLDAETIAVTARAT